MTAKIFIYIFTLSGCNHMLLETFIDLLEFYSFLSKFTLDVSRSKDILQINPIFLDDEPIINYQHCIVDSLLNLLSLCSLSFKVSISENSTKIGQQLI